LQEPEWLLNRGIGQTFPPAHEFRSVQFFVTAGQPVQHEFHGVLLQLRGGGGGGGGPGRMSVSQRYIVEEEAFTYPCCL